MSLRALFFCFLLVSGAVFGQLPANRISVGPDRIGMDESLIVTLTIFGSKYEIDDFPELAGFERGIRSIAHSETVIDGKPVEVHTIAKYYKPIETGEFMLPAFEIEVNGVLVKSEPKKILVDEDEEGYADLTMDIDDAEFVVECSKRSIYVGEGVKIRLSFWTSAKNTVNWQFPKDIGDQVEKLAKLLKPENSLESRNIISSILEREEYIKGQKYFVYDLFEAVYYPLNATVFRIPSLNLKMKKGESAVAVLKSKPQTIRTKEIADHPMKDKVPVGVFRMREELEGSAEKHTGESFTYKLTIDGQGNMDALFLSKPANDKQLTFFEGGSKKEQGGGKLAGTRKFTFKVLPAAAGEYDMGNYFSLIYFNIRTGKFDTLSPRQKIVVTGTTIATKNNVLKDIYSGIENWKTDESEFNVRSFLRFFANFILIFMVMVLIYIWKKK
jgi:hypothetical protein